MTTKQITAILAGMALVVILTSVLFFVSKPEMPTEPTATESMPTQVPPEERPPEVIPEVIEEPPGAKSASAMQDEPISLPTTGTQQPDGSQDTLEEPATHVHDSEETAADAGETAVMVPDFTDSIQQVDSTASEITVSGDANQIVFSFDESTEAYYDKTLLHISGPDGFSENGEFGSGEPVSFTGGLDDGIYKWEAVTVPKIPESVKSELMSLRESGNMAAASERMKEYRDQGLFPSEQEIAGNRQSGGFRIQDGVLVEQLEEE